ncbi:transcriptional regulator [Tistrella bauzanensis]|uniref:Transcriptional regulator n=1 Tax=Tistrella bauzanensis TaxID=657419 RepID=A0ABQ1IKR1_9PROT|nr:GntR family transcriptional regulator [Tistrella bauzanensis]GGB43082.1 transcriptional regulator [Tistrella bauzanensis]
MTDQQTHRRPTIAEQVQKRLADDILSGNLPPGSVIEETTLAECYGVSRTPVREAVRRLAESGLIDTRPRQRAVVARLTMSSVLEMFEVMAELEGLCARLAARRITPEGRIALKAACADAHTQAMNLDVDAYYVVNERFHELIYQAAHNQYLEQETRRLRDRLRPYRLHQGRSPGRMAGSDGEHAQVMAAILRGDADDAASLMRAHVVIQGDVLRDFILRPPPGLADAG